MNEVTVFIFVNNILMECYTRHLRHKKRFTIKLFNYYLPIITNKITIEAYFVIWVRIYLKGTGKKSKKRKDKDLHLSQKRRIACKRTWNKQTHTHICNMFGCDELDDGAQIF